MQGRAFARAQEQGVARRRPAQRAFGEGMQEGVEGVVGTLVRDAPTTGAGATGAVAGRRFMPIFAPISIRARTRLPVAGWVENRLSAPRPASGLMMNIWPVAGLRSAVRLTMPWA